MQPTGTKSPLDNFLGPNFSLSQTLYAALALVDKKRDSIGPIDEAKAERARVFVIKHERTIVFCGSVLATFLLFPRFSMLATGVGLYLKCRFYTDPKYKKYVQWIDPDDRILSLFEMGMALLGAIGCVLRNMYPRTVLELSPFLTGIALGSVSFDIYKRASEKMFSISPSSESKG